MSVALGPYDSASNIFGHSRIGSGLDLGSDQANPLKINDKPWKNALKIRLQVDFWWQNRASKDLASM
jgi:hypothetical protein